MKECKQCGKCCKMIVFKIPIRNTHERDIYTARGFHIKGNLVTAVVDHVCPQLTEDNKCRLHDTGKKPWVCRKMPTKHYRHSDIFSGCGME